tara:strand:- start:593 stop:787 length:195 start_codon:yes stop_codon:yes gene_type:complete
MSRVLHLSNAQFDVLYDIMVDTVDYLVSDLTSYYDKDGNEVEEKIEDYEAYKILLQLNNLRGKS